MQLQLGTLFTNQYTKQYTNSCYVSLSIAVLQAYGTAPVSPALA